MTRDIFISYASEDKDYVESLLACLEQSDLTCWIAPRDIPAGQDFGKAIFAGINISKFFLLVLSRHSNNSNYVAGELAMAFEANKSIICVRIEEVQPADSLRLFIVRGQWIQAVGQPISNIVNKLKVDLFVSQTSTTSNPQKLEEERIRKAEEEERVRKAKEEERVRKAKEEERVRKVKEEERVRKAQRAELDHKLKPIRDFALKAEFFTSKWWTIVLDGLFGMIYLYGYIQAGKALSVPPITGDETIREDMHRIRKHWRGHLITYSVIWAIAILLFILFVVTK